MLVSKFADHLPFYWQSQILADWAGAATFHLGTVVDRLTEHLKSSGKLFMPSRSIATQSPAG